ncbi:tellurium resistance protein TerC [Chryseobacterium wangxinyae]|uniref:MauE/DoxX family redox-associated membrane protein n=1 Tax=Chryseobacterium sp. CY350 TaxID=2997336 RepID=UPI00226E086C|nr:MauE/DoxX family redox-associated membrane protein [Chryseobacterium sp. CY350]MCY0976860.1 tellurium resistance protein TerC [Chryseobacterium sp. CY350]WBZ96859.1 tellurium resistance protein TerC [Chryseobacterium sp. CY350]
MKKLISHIPVSVSYFFVLLFCYAAISKMLDFENFQVQIGQSPLLSAYAGFISYAVIILEIVIVILLIFPRSNLFGLYASTALMSAFTIYIFLILNYSEFVPCSCGGILEKMGWTEHFIFNILCVIMGGLSVFITERAGHMTNLKTSLILGMSNILSCILVIVLFFKSEHVIKQENNFTRRFLMHPILKIKSMDLDSHSFYFAGAKNEELYLANRNLPQNILAVDSLLNKVKNTKIDLELSKYPFKKIEIKVKNNDYYIYDGNVPIILKGKLGDAQNKIISLNDAFFSQLEIIDSTQIAIRTLSSETKNLTLGTIFINNSGKNQVKLHSDLLEKQLDGIFDSDGYLSSDPKTQTVSYIYSYRNQFLVMNHSMQISHRLRTIDTTKTAQIKVSPMSNGKFKMSQPALKVNGHAIVYRGLLFNPAQLRGKHESSNRWKESKVIDIYNTASQEYIGSMYIDNIKNNSMSDFRVTDEYLYAIVGNQLVQYRITQPLKKHFKNGEAENRVSE